jgi:hypothetical protein
MSWRYNLLTEIDHLYIEDNIENKKWSQTHLSFMSYETLLNNAAVGR